MPPAERVPDRLPSTQPARHAGYDPYSAASYYGAGYDYYSSAAAYGAAAGAAAKAAADSVPLPPPPAKALAALAAAQEAAKAAKEGGESEDAEKKKEEVSSRVPGCSRPAHVLFQVGEECACPSVHHARLVVCQVYATHPLSRHKYCSLACRLVVQHLLCPCPPLLSQERRNAVLVPLLKGAKLAVAGPGKASPATPQPLGLEAPAEAASAADPKPDAASAAKPAVPAAKPAAPPTKPAAPRASAPAPPASAPAPTKAAPKALYLPPSIR